MCQPQHPHKNEIHFVSNDWTDGTIAIGKNDRENDSTFSIVRKGRALMPKHPEPPRLPLFNPRAYGKACRSHNGNG